MRDDNTPAPAGGRRLLPLRALPGYHLADGEPDLHGWPVVDVDGTRLGTVDELLVEPESAEVVALAVTPAGGDGIAVVPMDRGRIDTPRRAVVCDLTRDELAALASPRAAAPPAASAATSTSAPARAATDASTAELLAGHPGVTVERTADGEEVIRVPIVREELVVERRPVVKEVVVIRKHAVTEERTVEADLRHERVDVDDRQGLASPRDVPPRDLPPRDPTLDRDDRHRPR